MTVRDGHQELERLGPSGGQYLEYLEGVSRIEAESAVRGGGEPEGGPTVVWSLVTWVSLLQIQVDRHPESDSDLFELDFDHTFKDRGQRSVLGRLTIPLPAEDPR